MGKNKQYALDPANYTIEEVATKAREFLFEDKFAALAEKPKAELSFYVGGYSSGANQPERWLVKIRGEANESPPPGTSGRLDIKTSNLICIDDEDYADP